MSTFENNLKKVIASSLNKAGKETAAKPTAKPKSKAVTVTGKKIFKSCAGAIIEDVGDRLMEMTDSNFGLLGSVVAKHFNLRDIGDALQGGVTLVVWENEIAAEITIAPPKAESSSLETFATTYAVPNLAYLEVQGKNIHIRVKLGKDISY